LLGTIGSNVCVQADSPMDAIIIKSFILIPTFISKKYLF
jgi:hypothetical protein